MFDAIMASRYPPPLGISMRKNLPLTGREQSFDQSQRLISATDAAGKILYCNDEFEAIDKAKKQCTFSVFDSFASEF